MRSLVAVLLVGCASAAPPPAAPTRSARTASFDPIAWLASPTAPSDAECRRARALDVPALTRARIERRCGDRDAAARHYRAALAAEARCEVALELAELSSPDAQRALLEPFVVLAEPSLDMLEPQICRGAALRLAALLRGAEDDAPVRIVVALLERDATDHDALSELALHHLARGQLGVAARVCERVPSDHAAGMDACGQVALRQGRLHDAEARLRASVAADPSGHGARTLGMLLVDTRRPSEALPLLHRLHREDPTDYDRLVDLGVALAGAWCTDGARAAYRRAAESAPERPEAWYDLGLLYEFERTEAQARESLDAFGRFEEIARGRPELAPRMRTIRDEACLARVRAPRDGVPRAGLPCDPGHEWRLLRFRTRDVLAELQRRFSAPPEPGPEPPPRSYRCEDFAPLGD